MRRTLFLLAILVPAAALVGLLWDSGERLFGSGPSVAQRTGGTSLPGSAASRPQPVVLADGSGTDVFLERAAETIIDGKTVRFPRSYWAARSYEHTGRGMIAATGPVLVFNPVPKSGYGIDRLVRIDPGLAATDAVKALELAFGSQTGIRARQASIEGDADLSRIARVEFSGGVEALIVDAEVPDDAMRLETERLVLVFDAGEIVSASTDLPFRITRPRTGDFVLEATGATVDLRTHHATLLRAIRVEAVLPPHIASSRDPLVVTTPGPVDVDFSGTPGKPSFSLAGSQTVAKGGVAFSQGDVRGTADEATVTCSAGDAIESLDLVGSVKIVSPDGEALGSRLLATPLDDATFLRLEGNPVTITMQRGSSFLPDEFGEAAVLTTPGVVKISPVREDSEKRRGRTTDIGPMVAVDATTGHLDARQMRVWTATGKDALVPFTVTLDAVRAHDPETNLRADRATVVRQGSGGIFDDLITLSGAYEVLYRPRPSDAAGSTAAGSAAPESRRDVPNLAGAPVLIRGGGSLAVTRPRIADRPMIIVVKEDFHAEALGSNGEPPRGTLDAGSARVTFESEDPPLTPGAHPSRVLATFQAEHHVRIEIPDRARARGDLLTYDARFRRAVLRTGPGDPAYIESIVPGSKDWLRAGTITFNQDVLQIVATQGTDAEVAIAPLPWIGAPRPERGRTVPSQIRAQRLVASLDGVRYANGEIAIKDVLAEIAVRVTQPDRTLTADAAQVSTEGRSGWVRGAPVGYAVVRSVDGTRYEEGLTAPLIAIDGGRLLIKGPGDVRYHAKSGFSGQLPRIGDSSSRPRGGTIDGALQDVVIRFAKQAVMAEDFVLAEGRVQITQGDPRMDGMSGSADAATLFLEKAAASSRRQDRDVDLLVLEGHAKYDSADIDAASDVMKLNRVTKHAALFNERPDKVTVIMNRVVYESGVVHGASRLDVDFTNPSSPRVIAFDHEAALAPETRSDPR